MLLSDIHYGEKSDLNPINEYNSEIIKERLLKYFSEVNNIAEEHNIKKINVCSLGDLITNFNIFKSQITILDKDVISQVIELSEILSRHISELSCSFNIDFHYVFGNHGRVSYDVANETNFEKIIVEFLKLRLKDNHNIKFYESNGCWDILKIYDYNYLLIHGDQLSDKNSPYRLKEIINNLGINITEILSAHTHHSVEDEIFSNGFGILLNGSVIGGNSYSFKKLMLMTKSSQTCFIVEKNKGRTAMYRVRLNLI